MNPYENLPNSAFWSRSVSYPHPSQVDPVTCARIIGTTEKVATMGSCFAQHLAKRIARAGLNYYVAEQPLSTMTSDEAEKRNYGTFSARYGNVYTVRQALQLFDRAFGVFEPEDSIWSCNGGYVDAFRPRIDPVPAADPQMIIENRVVHLAAVRQVFEASDWLIFTLGLTEAWRSKVDGAVYPLAPGFRGGDYNTREYEYINFSAAQVQDDLFALYRKIKSVNKDIKILLTVSPVQLAATYEPRHVLSSTMLSKSVLRVSADALEKAYNDVFYFPSYEIITSPSSGNRYFEDNLREINQIGVNHVMRVFMKHFVDGHSERAAIDHIVNISSQKAVVCDEDAIQESLARSGARVRV